ncbi:hypothetical protein JOM56_012943 [Amanita muscaria]
MSREKSFDAPLPKLEGASGRTARGRSKIQIINSSIQWMWASRIADCAEAVLDLIFDSSFTSLIHDVGRSQAAQWPSHIRNYPVDLTPATLAFTGSALLDLRQRSHAQADTEVLERARSRVFNGGRPLGDTLAVRSGDKVTACARARSNGTELERRWKTTGWSKEQACLQLRTGSLKMLEKHHRLLGLEGDWKPHEGGLSCRDTEVDEEDHDMVVSRAEAVKGAVGVPTAPRWTFGIPWRHHGLFGAVLIDRIKLVNSALNSVGSRILQKCGRDHVRMVQGVCDGEHVEKGDRLREGSLKSSTSVFCSRTLQQPFSMPVSLNYLNSWAHIDIMASLPFFGEGDTPPREGYQLNGNSLMFRSLERSWRIQVVLKWLRAASGTSWTIRDGTKILLSRQRMRTLSGKTRGVLFSITKDRWERIGCSEVLAIDGYHGNLVLTGNSEASGDLEVEFQQRSAVGHRVQRSTAAGITPSNTERAHETSDGVRWVSGDAISIMDCAGSLIGRSLSVH